MTKVQMFLITDTQFSLTTLLIYVYIYIRCNTLYINKKQNVLRTMFKTLNNDKGSLFFILFVLDR